MNTEHSRGTGNELIRKIELSIPINQKMNTEHRQREHSKREGSTDVMWATKTLVGVESCSGVSAGNKRLRSIARHQNKMDPSKSAHWGALGPPNRTKYTSPIQQTCGFASWPGIPRLESIRIALWGPQRSAPCGIPPTSPIKRDGAGINLCNASPTLLVPIHFGTAQPPF